MKSLRSVSSWTARYFIFSVWGSITVVAFAWMILSSLKSNQGLFDNFWGLPHQIHLDNYVRALVQGGMDIYFLNSVVYAIFSVSILLVLGSMAAYAVTRPGVSRWVRLLYLVMLFGLSLPVQMAAIPLYLDFMKFHLIDTRLGLILAYCASFMPFTVFVLSGFFRTIPLEMEDAAEIDGCSRWQTFWLVVMPVAQAGLVTVSIVNLVTIWNEYFFAIVLVTSAGKMPLSAGLLNLQQQQQTAADWTAMIAGVVILFIPTLAVFLVFQRRISEGLTVGALKG